MTTNYRVLLMTTVALTASMVPLGLYFSGLTYICSRSVEDPEKRGAFLPRLKDVSSAFFCNQTQENYDKNHLATALCLSSKEFACSGRARKESKPYLELYSRGPAFLFRSVMSGFDDKQTTLVFKKDGLDLPGFSFSGEITSVFDPDSREKISMTKYCRCSVTIEGRNQPKKYDIIVVNGEEDPNTCTALGQAFQSAVNQSCRGEPYKREQKTSKDYYC